MMTSRSPSSAESSAQPVEVEPVLRRQFRAPAGDGELLAVPELSSCTSMVAANQQVWESAAARVGGLPVPNFRSQARRDLIEIATRIAGEWELPERSGVELAGPVIMTGHQPVLAHPGVWVKNFGVAAVAERLAGIGVNLIVDNDQSHPLELAVPTGTPEHVRMDVIPLDDVHPAQPWEERRVHNRSMLDGCGETCQSLLNKWGWNPLIGAYWHSLLETPGDDVVKLLSRPRILQEARWGVRNLEVPVSSLSESDSFRLFALQLILDTPRFHDMYNRAVAAYRSANKVTNPGQPVPFLAREGERCELPFWLWRESDRHRQPLFVVQVDGAMHLEASTTLLGRLPADAQPDADALTALQDVLGDWKLRPRALTTTLYSRLGLADLFVHGIGGAKYDEMADQLIQEFWGLQPPAFLTLTATLRLPVELPTVSEADLRALRRQLRDLQFNPGRQLGLPKDHPYWEQKLALVEEQQEVAQSRGLSRRARRSRRPQNRQRYRAFADLAASLAPQIEARQRELRLQIERMSALLTAKKILGSRELPAVLHPEERLLWLFDRVRQLVG